jgi:hypothetical protein
VRPRIIHLVLFAGLALGALAISAQSPAPAQVTKAPRFYPDDPLAAEPAPLPVIAPQRRALSAILETINSNVKQEGQRHPADGVIAAGDVNSLGEVMDGDWYVNRQATRRMTTAELERGPGNEHAPATDTPWQVLVVKPFGVNPGLLIADSKNNLYMLRFDPLGYDGLATGAQLVTSHFMYALGYYVTESYIVRFDRSRLVVNAEGQAVSSAGKPRPLAAEDVDRFLGSAPRSDTPGGTYRAVAMRLPEGRQALLGPYQLWGMRSDDPNDIVPHEHRRDLRGLSVFASWLNMSGFRAVNTQDIVVSPGAVPRIRHYLVDFTKSLGSSQFDGSKLAFEGHEKMLPGPGTIAKNIVTLGLGTPASLTEKTPGLAEVGEFGSSAFDPEAWAPLDPAAPFENRLPDDTFWAARQVMEFTDDEIRTLVRTGQYSKPAEDWITATLTDRRNRIGKTYFNRVLPLDGFRVNGNTLAFDDLGVKYGFAEARTFLIEWRAFDNAKDTPLDVIGAGPDIPVSARALPSGSYIAARIQAANNLAMFVTVYVRQQADGFHVVGIDRAWPGKHVVTLPPPVRADRRAFADLAPQQKALFETYVRAYNAARSSQYTAEDVFERLTVSEQTTFYGVTHAAMHSPLTDQHGAPLGLAIDRIESVERIAGQYEGKGGDEQFRLYVKLKPDTREILEKTREFFRDHENTVYHIGYPHSYRQAGKEPNMQVSMSDDGLRADIDVDYRSSKSPQALFNGHITSSNSDIRAGENPQLHTGRWPGLIAWWQDIFGKLKQNLPKEVDMMNVDRPEGPPTPLPPDRPSGASPAKIEDAAQEFLTDWLVRRNYDQALEFVSSKSYACLNVSGDPKGKALESSAAQKELRALMTYATARLGIKTDLTNAIVAFTPRNPNQVVLDQPFKREFTVGPLPVNVARQYLCNPSAVPPEGPGAEYYGVIFTFRIDGGGTLGLLWFKENGKWKLVSFQPLNQ